MLEKIDNVRVFYTDSACVGTLENGAKILYLPQQYGDIDYSEHFSHNYDIIIGHGPLSSETKNPCKSTKYEIMHSAELLGSISKICVFGHFHGYTDFGNNVYYTGPWLRWKYGEDEDRVFFFCDDKMKVFTVPNPYAKEFKTITIHNPEELREYVNTEITSPHRFIIESDSNDITTYKSIIMNTSNNSNIKYQLTEKEDDSDIQLSVDEANEITNTESSLPIPALAEYIKEKYNIDASEKLTEYEDQINKEKKND
jgi:hypothetical protein